MLERKFIDLVGVYVCICGWKARPSTAKRRVRTPAMYGEGVEILRGYWDAELLDQFFDLRDELWDAKRFGDNVVLEQFTLVS